MAEYALLHTYILYNTGHYKSIKFTDVMDATFLLKTVTTTLITLTHIHQHAHEAGSRSSCCEWTDSNARAAGASSNFQWVCLSMWCDIAINMGTCVACSCDIVQTCIFSIGLTFEQRANISFCVKPRKSAREPWNASTLADFQSFTQKLMFALIHTYIHTLHI